MKFFFPIVFCVLLGSCTGRKYEGYTRTSTGLYYRLVGFGDGEIRPKVGDYITLQVVYTAENDSVLYDSRLVSADGTVGTILAPPSFRGSFEEGLTLLTAGDSAEFLVPADSVFEKILGRPLPSFIAKGSMLKVNARMVRIQTVQEHDEEHRAEKGSEAAEMLEQKNLQTYLDSHHIATAPVENGLIHLAISEGTGVSPQKGNTVAIHYKAFFLTGKNFDSSYRREPFEFVLGEEGQVIAGLEKGVMLMKEGGKSKFILPSHLAYGSSGSSNGNVPPFTTVIYEVELLKVK
jgi:FKBP-type peptidyl-prolyl cis-trans isomerase